jgi:hypothetical protein
VAPLGCVDSLVQRDAVGDEMNEGETAPGRCVEAAEDVADMLHPTEQALDFGALLVEAPTGLTGAGAGRLGWNDRTVLFSLRSDC